MSTVELTDVTALVRRGATARRLSVAANGGAEGKFFAGTFHPPEPFPFLVNLRQTNEAHGRHAPWRQEMGYWFGTVLEQNPDHTDTARIREAIG